MHIDRRLQSGVKAYILQCLLDRHAVDHSRKHPHIVTGCTFDDPVSGGTHTTDDVTTTHNDRHLYTGINQ